MYPNWNQKVLAERQRQIDKGYTPEHDKEHGLKHLLTWAYDYLGQGKHVEVGALLLAAVGLLRTRTELATKKPSELPIFTMIDVGIDGLWYRDRDGNWVEAYSTYEAYVISAEEADDRFKVGTWKIVALPVEESQ